MATLYYHDVNSSFFPARAQYDLLAFFDRPQIDCVLQVPDVTLLKTLMALPNPFIAFSYEYMTAFLNTTALLIPSLKYNQQKVFF
jgi:hypothetical protein